jgi:hypothetical protein
MKSKIEKKNQEKKKIKNREIILKEWKQLKKEGNTIKTYF